VKQDQFYRIGIKEKGEFHPYNVQICPFANLQICPFANLPICKFVLFVYLKLSALNNFAGGIAKLEDINATKEIGKIHDIFLVGQ